MESNATKLDLSDYPIGTVEAAELLGCKEKTLREKYVWTGILPHHRIGRTYRFDRGDVLRFRKQLGEIETEKRKGSRQVVTFPRRGHGSL